MNWIPLALMGITLAAGGFGCSSKKEVYQTGVDDGYVLGASDAIKRQYWLKQSFERRADGEDDGELWYYLLEEGESEDDRRLLVPHKRAVPVRE